MREYIKRLPEDGDDPVARRRSKHYRYANLWSVRLSKDGYQPNHVHDRGWISAVYTSPSCPKSARAIRAPAGSSSANPTARPRAASPERVVEPKVGQLVLFPSYIWQGIIPFEGAERLS